MKISCIVPVFNASTTVTATVASILEASDFDLEVVLVDDGSTDSSLTICREISDHFLGSVTAHTHPNNSNCGVSATRNLGIRKSTGDLICFLDADDLYQPHRFVNALRILDEHPEVDGVFEDCAIEFGTPEDEKAWQGSQRIFGVPQNLNGPELLRTLLLGKTWHTSSILFRRSLLDRTGLFDETLHTAEDCHLWFRMAAVGELVHGKSSTPVSTYFRRGGSLFSHGWKARQTMLRALFLFDQWSRQQKLTPEFRDVIHSAIDEYAMNSISVARSAGERLEAWKLYWKVLCSRPGTASRGPFLSTGVHILRSFLLRDPLRSINSN